MRIVILISAFLLLGCTNNRPVNTRTIQLQLNENQSGHYFIIWSTDQSKLRYDVSKPVIFDKNKVVYLNYLLRDSIAIKPLNLEGVDISGRLKNLRGNNFYMSFYNPAHEEYKEHPEWDTFYLNKLPTREKAKLESIGYNFIDDDIKQKMIKLGKYQTGAPEAKK